MHPELCERVHVCALWQLRPSMVLQASGGGGGEDAGCNTRGAKDDQAPSSSRYDRGIACAAAAVLLHVHSRAQRHQCHASIMFPRTA